MNTHAISTLDAKTFPLHGLRLIEASAGTGKTYTIANLYLRLLLNHGSTDTEGQSTAHSQPLGVDQILVVTFTEVATGELRDRIRARIHATRMAFIQGASDDDFLQHLIDSLDNPETCKALLLAAERQMDEAAIFTIHGFCQRMLKQHAFESGTLFSTELITDENPLLAACAQDFWRRTIYPMDKPLAALARKQWKTPEDLLKNIRGWLNKPDLQISTQGLPDSIEAFEKQYIRPIRSIKFVWRNNLVVIGDQIRQSGLKKNNKAYKYIEEMEAFIQSNALVPKLSTGKNGWELYSTALLQKGLSKDGLLPSHPVFTMIDEFLNNPTPLTAAFEGMIQHNALQAVTAQLKETKALRHQQSFNDLLTHLADALNSDHGPVLAHAIRHQYRVAMIDEFQDTDPKQYDIFNTLYAHHTQDTGLFMIGDPKQAIYAFRGADIFTYITARRQINAHYTLDTNWRSSGSMIKGVNHLFQQATAPFIYDNDIPFNPVKVSPQGQHKSFVINGVSQAAMHLWLETHNESSMGTGDYQASMSLATATEINQLLTLAQQGHCLLQDGDSSRPLRASDIAILVRTKRHAAQIRKQLAKQGIASIYLSSSDSVFSCQEATDLQRILTACLSPTDDRRLRAALATPLFGLSAQALDQLNSDEQVWEAAVEEFTHYQTLWFTQGVLPMLRRLIYRRQVAENILTSPYGERQLTDLLHLGELLAAKALELDSHHGLVHWLADITERPDDSAAEQQLHLESERNLVKISTIHKSKGLEYNVVFVPMPCVARTEKQALFHDDAGQVVLDLLNPKAGQQKADQERLAEDLRLLYVAITRSVYRCYLGIAPVKPQPSGTKTDLHKTALGWLMNGASPIEADGLAALLASMIASSDAITTSPPPTDTLYTYQPPATEDQPLDALTFSRQIERNWWVTSYSALSRHSVQHTPAPAHKLDPDASLEQPGFDNEVSNESQMTEEGQATADSSDPFSLFNFPKGATPGTFLHTLFERVNFSETEKDVLDPFIKEQLLLAGYEEHWSPALCSLLQHCLNTPLDGDTLLLSQIPEEHRKVEMEFTLPIKHLTASRLNQVIKTYDPMSAQLGDIDFQQVKGMLKGFIDLTFVYNDKWYVLDYKSNWLGDHHSAYSQDNMATAMMAHRYDLQYQLYSLALHRLLKQRLPDYDYNQHFGGVYYLFLRGVTPTASEQYGIFRHCPDSTLIDKLDALFETGT